jgi:hypothetical protein
MSFHVVGFVTGIALFTVLIGGLIMWAGRRRRAAGMAPVPWTRLRVARMGAFFTSWALFNAGGALHGPSSGKTADLLEGLAIFILLVAIFSRTIRWRPRTPPGT